MGDTSSNEEWDAEDLPKHVDRARRLGFEEVGYFFPLCTPSLSGTFIYFVRRWGLAKNCSLFSPVLFYMKLLKVRAKGMEAIKLRIQEVCLKRPDISFEERISFQDVLAAQKK